MRANPVEHLSQIGKGVNAAQLAGGDDTVDGGRSLGSSAASGEQPVVPRHGHAPQDPFG